MLDSELVQTVYNLQDYRIQRYQQVQQHKILHKVMQLDMIQIDKILKHFLLEKFHLVVLEMVIMTLILIYQTISLTLQQVEHLQEQQMDQVILLQINSVHRISLQQIIIKSQQAQQTILKHLYKQTAMVKYSWILQILKYLMVHF